MLEQKLEQDIKAALLSGDTLRVSTLRGVKAALLNLKVATGKRESGLSDEEVISLLAKEAKRRQESADLYIKGGDKARAESELSEKAIIEAYLPEAPSEEELQRIVDEVINQTGASSAADMGPVIGQVRSQAGPTVDGGLIARLVKQKLAS